METNPEIELAWQCVEKTGSHLFLTGKAGTGKTTFLRKLKELSPKRMVVVAPTGIAAINAGGVTIHSFFQLPLTPYIPEATVTKESPYKFGKEKLKIIRSMDLLVIDEISMVRADLLDAIDAVLRRYRDRHKPFGGLQLLMIGDLQQLAPVVKDDEWALLSRYYDSQYFFGSRALKATNYITIQLEHVYRQSDAGFLTLLNKIRVNDIDDATLGELNRRYIPGFNPAEEAGYVRLTTHNYQANRINDRQLSLLPGQAHTFRAEVEGNFPESAYPADMNLVVKTGAQIMFIKNDSSADKRYYNGKIGVVVGITPHGIVVRGRGEENELLLAREEWGNSRYTLNEHTREITEVIEGVFRQYPIRLAWAITIHKSQGLTFEHAIIDAAMAFAHGQVYVALSRCKTLEGMVLGTPLTRDAVICDETINAFNREAGHRVPDKSGLNDLMQRYYYDIVGELFDYAPINRQFLAAIRLIDEHLYRLYPKLLQRFREAHQRFEAEIEKISTRFQLQYSGLILGNPDYETDAKLQERIKAGAGYFREKTDEILLPLLEGAYVEIDNKEIKKKYTDILTLFSESIRVKTGTLEHVAAAGFSVTTYLKKKAVILLSLQEEVKKPAGKREKKKMQVDKPDAPTDVKHPALYAKLIRWRVVMSKQLNMPAYVVLQQKALILIVNQLPTTIAALEKIPYCGEKTVERFGPAIVAMVRKFVESGTK